MNMAAVFAGRRRDRLMGCITAAVPACLLSAAALADDTTQPKGPGDDWSMHISPYVWAAGLDGSIAPFPRAPEADVDVGFSDILKHLDLAGMAFVELRYQRFGGYMDLIYTSIGADEDTPFEVLFDDIDATNEIFIGTFGGSYRPIETEHVTLGLLAGIRAWSVQTDVKLRGGLLPDQDFEHKENWIDPVIGLSGHYQFDNGIFLRSLFQIGGFGASSDLTWDALGVVGYRFNDSISALAGYRHLDVDYHNDGFVFDVDLSGPLIGMTITF